MTIKRSLRRHTMSVAKARWQWTVQCLIIWSLMAALKSTNVAADEGLSLQDRLPKLPVLMGLDDKPADLAHLEKAQVLIVAFTCNRCPYAVDYEERLSALHQKYDEADGVVTLLVINSNYGPDESVKQMAKRAAEQEFKFLYVKDSDQSVARSLGAVYTPEFFVFDQQRLLVYKGALDDSTDASKVKVNYVTDAVSALLAGKPIKTAKAGARGCTIRFKRRRKS